MISRISNLSTPWKITVGFLGFVLIFAVSFGVTFAIISFTNSSQITDLSTSILRGKTTDKAKTGNNPCPLNGAKYSDDQAAIWSKRRPLGVMIENHVDARPQSGLSRADIIYEAVAEGGITRFLAVYLCQDAGDIAPVRSARTYYLDWISEYDGLYAHVGGANTPGPANALSQIRQYQIKDLDQFGLGFPTYWRGSDRFAPHNVHTTTEKLWEAGAKRGWTEVDDKGTRWDSKFTPWQFKDEQPALEARPASFSARVGFWARFSDYAVDWKYSKDTNSYLRFHGDSPQIDSLTNEQISAKVVVVQFEDERTARDGYPGDVHLLYKTIGSGKALLFQDGTVAEITWKKADRLARTRYSDKNGNEIKFNYGQIWIQTVPTGADIIYQ